VGPGKKMALDVYENSVCGVEEKNAFKRFYTRD
jgi:hypothetical protein